MGRTSLLNVTCAAFSGVVCIDTAIALPAVISRIATPLIFHSMFASPVFVFIASFSGFTHLAQPFDDLIIRNLFPQARIRSRKIDERKFGALFVGLRQHDGSALVIRQS